MRMGRSFFPQLLVGGLLVASVPGRAQQPVAADSGLFPPGRRCFAAGRAGSFNRRDGGYWCRCCCWVPAR
ncbi:hypothetical protein ACFQT0_31295 [Hymenobacter humi]|uniref:Uncharacterized protein n=1 Tax=Hymenobacter humi TaxID=1411620 RepID=A0ABW2UE60_9BACT